MDMQWTTGSASGGVGGFGGTPATVGVNKGDGSAYVQIGRFDKNSAVYDGPGLTADGVNYLDYQAFLLNVSNAQNIEPASSGFPVSNILRLNVGERATLRPTFIGPEVGQSVTTTVNTGGLCGATYTVANGETSVVDFQVEGLLCNVGTHLVTFVATDNYVPAKSTTVTLSVVVENPCNMTIGGFATPVSCFGGTNGAVNITPINGKAPLAFQWSDGRTTKDVRNMPAGIHTVTVTDAYMCVATAQFKIDEPARMLNADFVVPSAGCPLKAEGQIDMTVIGGTAPYSYSWTNGSTAEDQTGIANGDYAVTVIDANGCSLAKTVSIAVSDNVLPTVRVKPYLVALDAAGSASISVANVDNGSSDNCELASLSLNKTHFTCSDLGQNAVVLTAVDGTGNSASAIATVTVVDEIAPIVMTQDINVKLDTAGRASISVADINAGSTDNCGIANMYLDQTSFDCGQIGANWVTLTVVDNSGNVSSDSAMVYVLDSLAPKLLNATADFTVISTPNDCDPQVYWTVPSVEEACPFTLVGTHTPGDEFALGTTAVTYTVTDASGNSATATIMITVQAQPLISAISSVSEYAGGYNVSCAGLANGSASVSVDGGCLPYSYIWSNGQTDSSAHNLAAGTYTVTASDANGTETVARVTLTEPAVLQASLTSPSVISGYNTSCNVDGDGSAALTAQGGVAPYTVAWSNGEANTFGISGLNAGNYSASVTDQNGCAVAVSIELTKPVGCNCNPIIPVAPATCASCTKVIDGKQWVNIGANDVATVVTSYNSGVNFQQGTLVIRGTANIPSLNLNAGDSVIVLGNLTVGGINLNSTAAVFLNFGTVTVNGWSNLNGTLTNYGQLEVTNGININDKGALVNNGNAEITASFNLNGALVNNGYIKIPGTVYANSNADLVNNCTFEIGSITINTTRTFKNNGTFTASQKLVLNNTLSYFGAGSITSLANLTSNNASLNNTGASCSLIEIANNSTFNGGRANGPIAICDENGVEMNNNLYLQNGAALDCQECAYTPLLSVLKSSANSSDEVIAPATKPAFNVYPTPVAIGADVYVSFGNESYTLNVFSTLGVNVYSVSGEGTVIVPASRLGAGSFILQLVSANGSTEERTIIVE